MMAVNSLNRRDARITSRPRRPVRDIPINSRHVTGHVSWRESEPIPYESPLERDFVLRQEFSLVVSHVLSQPCCVPFVTHSGRRAEYTPDYLVSYAVSDIALGWEPPSLLVEVKSKTDWQKHWREWSPKWKAARRYAAEHGWRFTIMDEDRIRTPALANIAFLKEYRDLDVDHEDSDAIVEDVKAHSAVKVDYLLAKHFPGLYRARGIAHIWHLIARRRLDCDVGRELSDLTEVWVPHGR